MTTATIKIQIPDGEVSEVTLDGITRVQIESGPLQITEDAVDPFRLMYLVPSEIVSITIQGRLVR